MTSSVVPPQHAVLGSIATPHGARAVVVIDGKFLPLQTFLPSAPSSLDAVVGQWETVEAALTELLLDPRTCSRVRTEGGAIDPAALRSPVSNGQTFCAIGNYRAQLLEAALDARPGDESRVRAELESAWRARREGGAPYVASTGTARIGGPAGTLNVPPSHTTLDWEVEIAAVVGRRGWRLEPEDALDIVAAYCVANDLTRRDAVFRTDTTAYGTDWLASKGLPGSLRLGPWLVPAALVDDPDCLELELKLNGDIMQAGRSDDMLFSTAEIIAHISAHTVLRPGDVVCTGSPAGFGTHYGRYLRDGDYLEASVDGLGTQTMLITTHSADSTQYLEERAEHVHTR